MSVGLAVTLFYVGINLAVAVTPVGHCKIIIESHANQFFMSFSYKATKLHHKKVTTRLLIIHDSIKSQNEEMCLHG